MDVSEKNPKARGLGRGLNALFDDDEADSAAAQLAVSSGADLSAGVEKGRQRVGVDQLEPGAGQPRRVFKEDALAELAESIRQHGVLQPLLVRRKDGAADRYEIIAGERRWRAAQQARLHDVPVIILDLTDAQAYEVALIENLQREDLDPVEEAAGFRKLMEEYDYTQEKLAESLGKSRSYIANMTRLLNLPESVQEMLSAGELSVGHGRALITALDPEKLAKEVVERSLSVRETETLVASLVRGGVTKPRRISDRANDLDKENGTSPAFEAHVEAAKKRGRVPLSDKGPDVLALEKGLSDHLGMRVSIDSPDSESGVVTVAFSSLDQMDMLLKLLSQPLSSVDPRLRG